MREDRSGIIFLIIFFLVVGFMVYWIYFGMQETPINRDYSWYDYSVEENCEVSELSLFDGKTSVLHIKDNSVSGLTRLVIVFSPKEITEISFYIKFETIQDSSLIFWTYRLKVDDFDDFDSNFSPSEWHLVNIHINGTGNQTIISININNQFVTRSITTNLYSGEYISKMEFKTTTIKKNNISVSMNSIK